MSSVANPSDHRLLELQALTRFKELLGREGDANVTPFSNDRIVCYKTDINALDVPAIHGRQRELLLEAIREMRDRQTAKVVILTGNPGMGKTHLLNYFTHPDVATEHSYILVRPGNDWTINEFAECLLDSLLAALVHPSPSQPHLLSERVEAIAFTALDQLLHQPGSLLPFRKRGARGWVRRTLERLFRSDRTRLLRKTAQRDISVFRELDFLTFTGYICDRFLAEPGNPLHRYVLRVLLCSLFPEERERVHHWFRRVPVGNHFSRKFGVEDGLDAAYKRMAAVRLLVSLFDREVSAGLRGPEDKPLPQRVFFLAFDQIEGRDEMFEREEDWFTFFAHLSELYNSLPNVLILFTMTLRLRERLHPRMEKQFQDRIQRDEHFVLHYVENTEMLALYRQRLDRWIGPGEGPLRQHLESLDKPYLPFDQAQVLEMAEHHTLRGMLEVFDTRFRAVLLDLRTTVELDYRLWRREAASNLRGDAFKDTEQHLDTVERFLQLYGASLAARVGIGWDKVERVPIDGGNLHALLFHFVDPNEGHPWVRVFLVRLPYKFTSKLDSCIELLSYKQKNRYSLWLLRAGELDRKEIEQKKPGQVHARQLRGDDEITLQAMIQVLEKKSEYPADEWQRGEEALVAEFRTTYLSEVFEHAAMRVKGLLLGQDENEEACPPATPLT